MGERFENHILKPIKQLLLIHNLLSSDIFNCHEEAAFIVPGYRWDWYAEIFHSMLGLLMLLWMLGKLWLIWGKSALFSQYPSSSTDRLLFLFYVISLKYNFLTFGKSLFLILEEILEIFFKVS